MMKTHLGLENSSVNKGPSVSPLSLFVFSPGAGSALALGDVLV